MHRKGKPSPVDNIRGHSKSNSATWSLLPNEMRESNLVE